MKKNFQKTLDKREKMCYTVSVKQSHHTLTRRRKTFLRFRQSGEVV